MPQLAADVSASLVGVLIDLCDRFLEPDAELGASLSCMGSESQRGEAHSSVGSATGHLST